MLGVGTECVSIDRRLVARPPSSHISEITSNACCM